MFQTSMTELFVKTVSEFLQESSIQMFDRLPNMALVVMVEFDEQPANGCYGRV